MDYDAVIIGTSAGGFKTLETLVSCIEVGLKVPIIIVQHISPSAENYIVNYLSERTDLNIKEVDEKEKVVGGTIYFAPPNYHILLERDKTISLSVEKRVSYSRPSIDVVLETAAETYLHRLLGVILTGANSDGTKGCEVVKHWGGTIFVQDPKEAEFDEMPLSVIKTGKYDMIITIQKLIEFINQNLCEKVK